MCLYPRKYVNKKYTATVKNGGIVPKLPLIGKDQNGNNIYDERILKIEIPCGNCEECRKAKTREWQVRLTEEIKEWNKPYFMTLTFSPEALANICKKKRLHECNAVAGFAIRHMLEKWRKTHKKSLKHWFITELGHEGTERIHMHGIIFTNEDLKFTEADENQMRKWEYWKYGHVYVGTFCTLQTVNYIVKYINKIDTDHLGFKGQIFASPGIGKVWLEKIQYSPANYAYRPKRTINYYTLNTGNRIKLPKYYANKLRSEEERELIWREFLDAEKESIYGVTYKQANTFERELMAIQERARETNKKAGYGDDSQEWRQKPYNITKRMLQHQERIDQIKKMQDSIKKVKKMSKMTKNIW